MLRQPLRVDWDYKYMYCHLDVCQSAMLKKGIYLVGCDLKLYMQPHLTEWEGDKV